MTNSEKGGQLNPEVTNLALEHYLGVSTPEPTLKMMPRKKLAEYAGSYKATLTEAEVEPDEGNLVIKRRSLGGFPTRDIQPTSEPLPPVRYGFYGKDHIVGMEAPNKGDLGQFLRNPDGSIAWLRLGLRIHRHL